MSNLIYSLVSNDQAFQNPLDSKLSDLETLVNSITIDPPSAWGWSSSELTDAQNAFSNYKTSLSDFREHTNLYSGVQSGDNDVTRILSIAFNAAASSQWMNVDYSYTKPENLINSVLNGGDAIDENISYFTQLDIDLNDAGSTPKTGSEVVSEINAEKAKLDDLVQDDNDKLDLAEEFLKESGFSRSLGAYSQGNDDVREVLKKIGTDELNDILDDEDALAPPTVSSSQGSPSSGGVAGGSRLIAENIFVQDKKGYYSNSNLERILEEIGVFKFATFENLETRITTNEGSITTIQTQTTALEDVVYDQNTGVAANASSINTLQTKVTDHDNGVFANASNISEIETSLGDIRDTGVENLLPETARAEEDSNSGTWTKGPIEISLSDVDLFEGDVVSVRGEGRTDGGGIGVWLRVEIRANNVILDLYEANAYTGTSYQEFVLDNITIPATANNIRVGIFDDGGSGVGYGRFLSTNRGPIAIPFENPRATAKALSLLETTVSQQGNSITSNSQAITSLENVVYDPTTGVSANSSAIDTLETTVANHEDGVFSNAKNITVLESEINAAQSTADSKVKTFIQSTEPTATTIGDVWYDTSDGNRMHRWNGTSWIDVHDTDIDNALSDAAQAINDAADAQATADGKVTTYYQAAEPVDGDAPTGIDAIKVGDLWVDTDNGNLAYRYDGNAWVEIQDQDIQQALQDVSDAQATADGKILSFYQTTEPTSGDAPTGTSISVGDLWFDTDDDNHPYRYNGTSWIDIRDNKINEIEAIADGKITSFYQTSEPIAEGIGDIWFDTDDSNKAYRWDGASWILARDGGIAQAISDASDAQATADGKITTYYQTTEPVDGDAPAAIGVLKEGDLWIDTDGGNKAYRYDGSVWADIQDDDISQALTDAANAQTTANSKVQTFYQTTAPTASTIGDLWFDTDDNNKAYRWDGSNWISVQDGQINLNATAISNLETLTTDIAGSSPANILDENAGNEVSLTDSGDQITSLVDDISVYNLLAGDIISASISIKSDGSMRANPRLQFLDGTDTLISETEFGDFTNTSYERKVLEEIAIPAGTVKIAILDNVRDADTGTADFKNRMVNRGPVAFAYENPLALATSLETLSTTVGNNTTTISQNSTSINGLEGQYAVKITTNAGGKEFMAGFGLSSEVTDADDPQNFSEFRVIADRFVVYDEDSLDADDPKPLFSVGDTPGGGTDTTNNFTFGAQIFEDEITTTSTLFDGTDENTWKDMGDVDVYIRETGNIVSVEILVGLDVPQITDNAVSAGPGGPEVELRLLRDNVEIWVSDPVIASAAGSISFSFATKTDASGTEGIRTYKVQARWNKTTYSAGTVDLSDNPFDIGGKANSQTDEESTSLTYVKGNGTYWLAYTNDDWEIRILDINDFWYKFSVAYHQVELSGKNLKLGLNTNTGLAIEATTTVDGVIVEWPSDISTANGGTVTGLSYEMRNPHQMVKANLTNFWIRAIEYASPNIR